MGGNGLLYLDIAIATEIRALPKLQLRRFLQGASKMNGLDETRILAGKGRQKNRKIHCASMYNAGFAELGCLRAWCRGEDLNLHGVTPTST